MSERGKIATLAENLTTMTTLRLPADENVVISHSKTRSSLTCMQKLRSYRAVKKIQTVDVLYREIIAVCSEIHTKHIKFTVAAECRIFRNINKIAKNDY